MNPETRNLVAAICLSMSVLIGYQLLFVEPKKELNNQQNIVQENTDTSNIPLPSNTGNGIVGVDNTASSDERKAVPRISMLSKEASGSISLKGARIDDITLTQYRETLDPESDLIKLLLKSNGQTPYFIEFGWSNPKGIKVPNGKSVWKASGEQLTPNKPVTLSWDNGEGMIFYQDISIDDTFMITVNQRVQNNSKEAVTLYPYGLIRRAGEPKTIDFFVLHEGPLGVFDGTLSEKSYGDLTEAGKNGINVKPEEIGRAHV